MKLVEVNIYLILIIHYSNVNRNLYFFIMTTYYTFSSASMAAHKISNKAPQIIKNLENINRKARFSKEEITNVQRDFRYFGIDLLTIPWKPLNISLSDGKVLSISY